jgi:hypothetical protein
MGRPAATASAGGFINCVAFAPRIVLAIKTIGGIKAWKKMR